MWSTKSCLDPNPKLRVCINIS